MGIMKDFFRPNPTTYAVLAAKNMILEGSVKKGIKKTFKEDYCEHDPFARPIYKAGKEEGKKEGYIEAAQEYEIKLLAQAEEFLAQKEIARNQFEAYKALLDEYEVAISELEEKVERTEAENDLLRELLLNERKLRKLKVG